MSGTSGELLIAVTGGVGATLASAALLYVVRQVRKIPAKIEAVMAAPQELVELRKTVTQNTQAISHLSSALEKIARLAEDRQGRPG